MSDEEVITFLKDIFDNGISQELNMFLCKEMMNSGETLTDWPQEWRHLVVDKHSSGGVGDKISLMLSPALAAVGLKVPMIAGRSLE